MAEKEKPPAQKNMLEEFRTSDHWVVSLARDILWLVAVVGGIALILYLICGTWPAVVTIESESMVPHMNKGDLVVVVQKDRFGELQTWESAHATGYKKYEDYGDVIIYRPNGIQDFWSTIGLLPFSNPHPIIHRAMIWVDEGQPEPSFINPYRGQVIPAGYVPLLASNITVNGYTIMHTGDAQLPANFTPGTRDLVIKMPSGQYILPSAYIVPGSGYMSTVTATTPHEGYITKGDNNVASDQGYLSVPGAATVEPVRKEWVVGKALFIVPLVGLLPLHITELIIVMVIAMVFYEWYLRRRDATAEDGGKKGRKAGKKMKK